jgi:hypothetical protein
MRRSNVWKLAPCLLAGVITSSAAGDAREPSPIQDPARADPTRTEPGGVTAQAPQTGTTRELSGKVVRASSRTVYLEHMGAIIPVSVDEKTRFSGEGVKSTRDLKEGQEVRTSFTVKGTANLAREISVASAGSDRTGAAQPGQEKTGAESLPVPPERKPPDLPSPENPRVPQDPRTVPPRDPGSPPVKY